MTTLAPDSIWTITRLRTRYFPRSRIGQGLISLCPWTDLVLLLVLFLLIDARIVLQPGVVVELPPAPFLDGTQMGLVAVVLSVDNPGVAERQEIVYFDDERFLADNPEQMHRLQLVLALRSHERPDAALVIQADRRVTHGTIMDLANLARGVGLKKVNVAVRPE
jgi:biopolymer transport protein ExbD